MFYTMITVSVLGLLTSGLELRPEDRTVVMGPWGEGDSYVMFEAREGGFEGFGAGWQTSITATPTRFAAGVCAEGSGRVALPAEEGLVVVDLANGSYSIEPGAPLGVPIALEGCAFVWVDHEGMVREHVGGATREIGDIVDGAPDPMELPDGLTLFATGKHLFVGDAIDTLARMDRKDGSIERVRLGARVMNGAARSMTGDLVWFATKDGVIHAWSDQNDAPSIVTRAHTAASTGLAVWPGQGLTFAATDGRLFIYDGRTLTNTQRLGQRALGSPLVADLDGDGAFDVAVRLYDGTLAIVKADGTSRRAELGDAIATHALLTQPDAMAPPQLHVSRLGASSARADFTDVPGSTLYAKGATLGFGLQVAQPRSDTRSGAALWVPPSLPAMTYEVARRVEPKLDPPEHVPAVTHGVDQHAGCSAAGIPSPSNFPSGAVILLVLVLLALPMRRTEAT